MLLTQIPPTTMNPLFAQSDAETSLSSLAIPTATGLTTLGSLDVKLLAISTATNVSSGKEFCPMTIYPLKTDPSIKYVGLFLYPVTFDFT